MLAWAGDPPDWLVVVSDPCPLLAETGCLDAGEASAITLAWLHRGDSRLILDEKRGRWVAEALGLPKTGVLGIIGHAAARHLLDFDASMDALRSTGFHLSDELVEAVRRRLP